MIVMKNQNPFTKIILITQLGISLIAPVLLCVFVTVSIQKQFKTGYWVVIAGILLGLASMINTFYRFCKKYVDEEKDTKPPGFNRHE